MHFRLTRVIGNRPFPLCVKTIQTFRTIHTIHTIRAALFRQRSARALSLQRSWLAQAFLGSALALSAMLLAGCDRNLPGQLPTMEIRIGGQPLTVEIAADPDSRTAGLKGRESMPENHGMLFAFPASEKVGFYMKDTPLALDVAFFDEQGFLIDYFSMHPDDGKAIYVSPEPALYAIETNRGWFRRNGVQKYAQLELPEPVRGR